MGLKIVTGRTGTPHVSSNQIQAFNRSLLGDLAILDLGQHFDAVVRDANTIRIYDGCIVVQGIYAVIPHDEYEDVLVEPVSVGNTRIDTIYLHYAKDMETDTETVELDIAQGEEAVNNPVKPDIDAGGDTWEGTTDIRIPLYDVTVTSFETTIVPYEYMNVYSPTISELQERIPETTVSGVKGDAESEYRSGNVNITPTNIGLGNVDNTADTDKPVSNATQTALNLKADLTYVDAKIAAAYHAGGSKTVAELTSALLIADNIGKVYNMSDSGVTTSDFVEGAGDPINEGDNVGICNVGTEESPIYKFDLLSGFVDLSAYATTSAVNAGLAGKVDKVTGKGLSTEDYTTTDKTKLAGISEGATQTIANPADTATETLSKLEVGGVVYDVPQGTTGATNLSELNDVNLSGTAEGDILEYDSTANKWKNSNALQGSKTTTGNPITIESSESNLVECVAEVEAVQEGSGDPSPDNIRPIIGQTEVVIDDAGKNLWNEVYPNIDANTKYKPLFVGNGQFTMSSNIPLATGNSANLFFLAGNVDSGASSSTNGISNSVSRTVTSVDGYVTIGYRVAYSISPNDYNTQIEKGSTATTYEPYKGKTYRVEIGQKNKWKFGDISGDGYIYKNEPYELEKGTYTISCGSFTGAMSIALYDSNNTKLSDSSFTSSQTTHTITINSKSAKINVFCNSATATDIQLEQGSQATPYVPYNPNLPEAIYGSELDVLTGELRVDTGYATVDEDSEILIDSGGSMFVATNTLRGAKSPISQSQLTGVLCNSLREVTQASTWGVQGTFSRSRQSITSIYFKITNDITTVEQVKTYLTSNPLQFVYELAEPYTIQLTPQQIKLLKSTNNLSCNTGDLSIKYYPDNVLGQLKGDIESEYDERITTLEEKANTPIIKQIEINRNAVSSDGSVMFTSLAGHIIVGTSIENDSTGNKCVGIPYSMGNIPALKIMNESTMAVLPNITISGILYCIEL